MFERNYVHYFVDQDKNGMEARFRWWNMNIFQKSFTTLQISTLKIFKSHKCFN